MIEVLDPNVANQIAAGEVVQRPSSIVKELVENAVDAGASRIIVRCQDGGRTLISVIDDGVGMTRDDAQKAFLRHATSKIRRAEDLFALRSFGFRGEALASIASVAQIEMRTRRAGDDLGTLVEISAGETTLVEPVDTPRGTSITVRNLFFNIPARRKFLKSDRTEAAAVYSEFQRVAMVNPDIEFSFYNNLSDKIITLAASGLHQRIVGLTKPSYKSKLLSVDISTDLVRMAGYVGTPDTATNKNGSAQFLFVNGRFVRSPFLQRAVSQAYDRLIKASVYPCYFLFIEVDPASIDVNINPTKTEVKFDDEQSVFQTVNSAIKACLGRANVVQAIDFDGEPSVVDIPSYAPSENRSYRMPEAHSGKAYNPFASYDSASWEQPETIVDVDPEKIPFMEMLPSQFGASSKPLTSRSENTVSLSSSSAFAAVTQWTGFQVAQKYLVVHGVEGLTVINIARARQRIAYEHIMRSKAGSVASQYLIAPVELDLSHEDSELLFDNIELIETSGFVVAADPENSRWELHALPSGLGVDAFDTMLISLRQKGDTSVRERLAEGATRGLLAQKVERIEDISAFVNEIFACAEPSFTPSGLPIIEIISIDELDRRMK